MGTPYWKSRDWPYAWGFLIGVICSSLMNVHAALLFNQWNGIFYDAVQNKDLECFIQQIWIFCWLLIYILIPHIALYLCGAFLSLRWRQWLTNKFMIKWLQKQTYYTMNLYDTPIDNPDQRIAVDLGTLAFQTVGLGHTLLTSILQFFSFSAILWHLSGNFPVSILSSKEIFI